MNIKKKFLILFFIILYSAMYNAHADIHKTDDKTIASWLEKHRQAWYDYNVPYVDGQTLYDIIVTHGYKSALEIGTSTGHSTVWIAWAMSKTGGKVITLELDEDRRQTALKNLGETGLLPYVDSRPGDAHELVKKLTGPFDFIFSDADKEWYKQYFIDLDPKLLPGGCFASHNVIDGMTPKDYLQHVKDHPNYITSIDRKSEAGIMLSFKRK